MERVRIAFGKINERYGNKYEPFVLEESLHLL